MISIQTRDQHSHNATIQHYDQTLKSSIALVYNHFSLPKMTTVDLDKAVETVKAIVIQAHEERRLRYVSIQVLRLGLNVEPEVQTDI